MADERTCNRRLPSVTPDVLSADERRVAKLTAAGCGADTVAETMSISREAVDAHCQSIYAKLGVDDRMTLIRWAMYYDIGRW